MPAPSGQDVITWADRAWARIGGLKQLATIAMSTLAVVALLGVFRVIADREGGFALFLLLMVAAAAALFVVYLVVEVAFVVLESLVVTARGTAAPTNQRDEA